MYKIKYTILFLLTILSLQLWSAEDDCFPAKSNRLVNDYVGTLKQDEVMALESKLVNFSRKTSTQIAVVIVDDICGYDRADYTYSLGEKWGVGQKGKNNGILIMVKPTGSAGQRAVFIATGYGVEGAVPDATAKRIVENEMIPRFKNNDIYGGINAACDVIFKLTEGEYTADDYNSKQQGGNYFSLIVLAIIMLIFFLSKFNGTRNYARKNK